MLPSRVALLAARRTTNNAMTCLPPNNVTYLSTNQLHERWGFHKESVRRMIREGRLSAVRFGKRLRVSLADIEAFEARGRVLTAPASTKGEVRR